MRKVSIILVTLFLFACCRQVERVPSNLKKLDVKISLLSIKDTVKLQELAPLKITTVNYSLYLSKKDSLKKDSLQRVSFKKVVKKVNGGYIGIDNRLKEWVRIKKILEKRK